MHTHTQTHTHTHTHTQDQALLSCEKFSNNISDGMTLYVLLTRRICGHVIHTRGRWQNYRTHARFHVDSGTLSCTKVNYVT